MSERTYSCPASPATQTQRTVCDQRSFCQGGSNCFDTSNPADQDFGKAMASMEAAREAGVYGADQRLFKGTGERCRKKLFGLVDCCKKGGGGAARSNHNLMAATMQGVMIGGQLAINAGSKYMFDFMYPLSGPVSNRLSLTAASTHAWPGSSMSRVGARSEKAGGAARARIAQASPRLSSSAWIFPGST